MLSIKLVRSLVLGETVNNPLLLTQNHHDHDSKYHDDDDVHFRQRRRKCNNSGSTKTPLLIFLPTKEVIKDTYRLATIAREMGMDLYPTPSLSHVIFSWPSSSSPSLASSFSSSSSSWSLSGDAIPLPFPSLTTASATHLNCFVHLSRGLFKLVFYNNNSSSSSNKESNGANISNWDCSSLTLFSRLTGECINSMDSFSRVLAGVGWTLFKTRNNNPSLVSVYLFRKVDSNRVRIPLSNGSKCGEFRIRELRLPPLDFKNAPLRILQYILLMTDDLFYLA